MTIENACSNFKDTGAKFALIQSKYTMSYVKNRIDNITRDSLPDAITTIATMTSCHAM